MLWAALLVVFFGFLRCSKLLALQHSNVLWRSEGYYLLIKASKTDPFWQGATIKLPISRDCMLYAVGALNHLLAEAGTHLRFSERDSTHPAKPNHPHLEAKLITVAFPQSDTHPTRLGLGQPLQLVEQLLPALYSSPRCGHQPSGGDTGKEPVVRNNNKVPLVSNRTLLNLGRP